MTVVEAKLIRDTDFLSKMDPYCILKTSQQQEIRTKTLDNAGKVPKWNETFEVRVENIEEDTMQIECLDQDITSSDLVGSTSIKLSLLKQSPCDHWVDILYKEKKAGSVRFTCVWHPN